MYKSNCTKLVFSFLALIFSFGLLNAQVNVSSGGTKTSGTYTTLKQAFDTVNAGKHSGVINITITGNTTETASAKLNSGTYTSLTITPVGGPWTISGNIANAGVITLNGADNVTIDGTVLQNLNIKNTNTATTSAAIWLNSTTSSTNCLRDVIKNCVIQAGIKGNSSILTFGIIACGGSSPGLSGGYNFDFLKLKIT